MVIGIDREKNKWLLSEKSTRTNKPQLVELFTGRMPQSALQFQNLAYGAYIDVSGVTGILKNSDFSVDHTTIRDVMKVEQRIDVKSAKLPKAPAIVF